MSSGIGPTWLPVSCSHCISLGAGPDRSPPFQVVLTLGTIPIMENHLEKNMEIFIEHGFLAIRICIMGFGDCMQGSLGMLVGVYIWGVQLGRLQVN